MSRLVLLLLLHALCVECMHKKDSLVNHGGDTLAQQRSVLHFASMCDATASEWPFSEWLVPGLGAMPPPTVALDNALCRIVSIRFLGPEDQAQW